MAEPQAGGSSPESLDIRKVVYPGRALGLLPDGRTCFTDEGLPGETVEIIRLKDKAGFVEARTVGIRIPARERVEPRCLHYRACSPYQAADYPLQLAIKAGQLRELLGGLAGARPDEIGVEASPRIWEYRNKVRFRVIWEAGRAAPGYNEPGSRDRFVPARDCRLLPAPVRETVEKALAAAAPMKASLEEIEVRISGATGEMMVHLRGRIPPKPREADPLLAALIADAKIVGIVHWASRKGEVEERILWGRRYLDDEFGGVPLRLGPGSFFQVNASIVPAVLAAMRSALEAAGAETLADLYCGVGAFGLALRPRDGTLYAVESEPESVALLKANVGRAGAAGVTICDGTAEEWLGWILDRKVDAAIVDPPRKGLVAAVTDGLAARPVPTLIYLSCNPSTLARDLARLSEAYRIESLRGFDFFPHTPHIETLAILRSKGVRSYHGEQ